MADVRSAWNEAGDKLQHLGASLKQHYATQRGEDAGQTKEQVGDAFKKVGEALQGAFDALGAAAKDPAVKDEAKQTGKSVADALAVTFTELSDDVRKAFDKRKGEVRREDETGQPWGSPEGTPSPAAGAGASGESTGTAAEPGAEPGTGEKQDPSSSI